MSTYAALFIQLIGLFAVAQIVITAPSEDSPGTNISANIYDMSTKFAVVGQNFTISPSCWVPYITLIGTPLMTWWGNYNRAEWADAKSCLEILKTYFQNNCAGEARARSGAYVCGAFLGSGVVVNYMAPVFDAAISNLNSEKIPDGKTWEVNIENEYAIGITIDYRGDHSNVDGAIAMWRSRSRVNPGAGSTRIGSFETPIVKNEHR
ncbi:uncharacterized protein LOC119068070 [Bradysia coprophila]|uniref:uncharacterized protein LOC119068070 n=1 Tax=Bradysia coprophila TaxID=38358 RepID=UPI00187D70D9|nr:uncharacterized protein LOC119068070 [Bradysia coprophila]